MADIDKKSSKKRKINSSGGSSNSRKIGDDNYYESLDLKYKKLVEENANLDQRILDFHNKGVTSDSKQEIIEVLHRYNEMKDLTSDVLGYLANIEQISVAELYKRYRLPTD